MPKKTSTYNIFPLTTFSLLPKCSPTNGFIFRENTQFFLKIFCSSGDIVDTLNNDLANCCCIIVSFAYWNIFKFYAVFCLDTNKRKRWEYETATSPISFDTSLAQDLKACQRDGGHPGQSFTLAEKMKQPKVLLDNFFKRSFTLDTVLFGSLKLLNFFFLFALIVFLMYLFLFPRTCA